MSKRFRRDTGTIPVELFAAGALQAPDGRPVAAISEYAAAPSDGRPVRVVTSTPPTDSSPIMAASLYANGLLITPDGRPIHAVQGANVLATYAQAMQFTTGDHWRAGTNYAALSSMPGYTFTRTGQQGATDTDGGVDFFAANAPAINGKGFHANLAATNILLNAGSATSLPPQSATVSAQAYSLSFIGPGSITLSGAHVATLAGTGANNRVVRVFTPTAGTLTLTVTGSVTFAVLLAGNYPNGGPIIATAGATAAIGASDLEVGATLPNGDFIAWAAVVCPTYGQIAALVPFTYSTAGAGSAADQIVPQINNAGAWMYGAVTAGNVAQPIAGTAVLGAQGVNGGRLVGMIRRRNGIYSLAAKKTDGVVAIGADASGVGLVPAVTALDVGSNRLGAQQIMGQVEGFYQRNGTFSDAEITAILLAA